MKITVLLLILISDVMNEPCFKILLSLNQTCYHFCGSTLTAIIGLTHFIQLSNSFIRQNYSAL